MREASAEVLGDGAFGRLKFESGVHRVQRVPRRRRRKFTARVHTSTAIGGLPHAEEVDMDVRDEDVRVDTMRASGAARNMAGDDEFHAAAVARLGVQVVIQDERSQHKNKAKAAGGVEIPTVRPRASPKLAKERAEFPFAHGTKAIQRGFCTHNFAQGRVKDHRLDGAASTTADVKALMDSFTLDEFTEALMKKRTEELLSFHDGFKAASSPHDVV